MVKRWSGRSKIESEYGRRIAPTKASCKVRLGDHASDDLEGSTSTPAVGQSVGDGKLCPDFDNTVDPDGSCDLISRYGEQVVDLSRNRPASGVGEYKSDDISSGFRCESNGERNRDCAECDRT